MARDPGDELTSKVRDLQHQVGKLQSAARLLHARDSLEDLDSSASSLVEGVQQLRTRGYPFEKLLEDRADDLEKRWPPLRKSVLERIEQEAAALRRELSALENLVRRAEAQIDRANAAQPLLERAEGAAEALEEKAGAAANAIEGMYDQFESEVQELAQHTGRLAWMLNQLAEADFRLLPSEAGIMAVRAAWQKDKKEHPQGFLYLTDQRLLFEQKQEIATKKVLFVTTETEKVQQLLLEAPVGQIEKVVASHRGLLGHEDHLDIDFASDAPLRSAHFHIDGQRSETWQRLIRRATLGEFDRDRAVPLDEELVERAQSAPTRCPTCNAPIGQRILRGMDRVVCEYCGQVIRV